jgi:hypothetical protein
MRRVLKSTTIVCMAARKTAAAGFAGFLIVTFGIVRASVKIPLQFGIAVATVVSRVAAFEDSRPDLSRVD